jgi:predicted dehydrogenase
MIRVCVVGAGGYWGTNLVRVLGDSSRFFVASAVDPVAPENDRSLEAALRRTKLDAVIVATPASTHAEIALDALERGLHVLVEKPLATSSADGEKLCAAAQAAERVLMVDHTYLYSPRVATLEVVLAVLGRPSHWMAHRTHDGGPGDVSSLWDLWPHDLAIVRALVPGWDPKFVEVAGDAEDGVADITGATAAHVSLRYSRRSPMKQRSVVVDTAAGTVEWNDQAADPIKVWDRTRGGWLPVVPCRSTVEPLAAMVDDFADAIMGRECRHPARSTAVSAVWGLRIIEAAERSLFSGAPERIT